MTSANVVGYNNVTINPGYNMFAVNFKQMGEDASIKIDDLFPGGGKEDTIFVAGGNSGVADYIKVWDNATGEYNTYWLYYVKKGGTTEYKNKWCNSDGGAPAVGNIMTPGKGAWYYHRGEGFKLPVKKQF